MTNKEILHTAMEQSAVDIGCKTEDFLHNYNIIVPFKLGKNARKYLEEPITANFVSYGNNVVIAANDDIKEIVTEYAGKFEYYHLFETPNLNWLIKRLENDKICFMAEYFLPDLNNLKKHECKFETRVLTQENFSELYLPEWSNALCEKRRELDVLGVGAYDNGKLVGLAGCSADCENMWQIGVDVLPEYRRNGIASALTSALAIEIIKRGKVPFYCAAWSNIRSVRNAVKSGFRPAWTEMTVKPADVVDEMNK